LLAGLGEDPDHLRHHIGKQRGDHAHGHQRDDQRIDEGEPHALRQRGARFDMVGQPRHHASEIARGLAGADQRPVDLRKIARETLERLAEGLAGNHLAAHRRETVAHIGPVGLLDDRRQRLLEGQAGRQQACQLPSRHRELRGAQPPPRDRGPLLRARSQRHDLERHQAALAQQPARVTRRLGIDHPAIGDAGLIDGLEAEGGHQSRVTRTTSSSEVTPDSTQRRPSSRIVSMPAATAAASSSACGALRWMRLRMVSSTVSSS
jgi:hypothetical protein